MKKKTRVIVLAAGEGARWNNYRGTPKHLVKIEGKRLLDRTCAQFLKYTDDVCVIGADDRYKVDGASLYVVKAPNTNWRDASKFMSSKNLWLNDGRTVLVFGDVFFTSDAVKTIMSDDSPYKFFLRTGPSEFFGARWKEIFAVSFNEDGARLIGQKLLHLISLGAPTTQAGWQLYSHVIGNTTNGLFNNPHFVEIDDWTEDFDFPEDLQIWETARKARLGRRKKQTS